MPSPYESVMVKTDPVGTQSGPVATSMLATRLSFSITAGVTTPHPVSPESEYWSVVTVTVIETWPVSSHAVAPATSISTKYFDAG